MEVFGIALLGLTGIAIIVNVVLIIIGIYFWIENYIA